MSSDYQMNISGEVRYLEKVALLPNSTLHVTLQDISLQDVPAKELASQTIRNAETTGLDFDLVYNTADVLDGHRYSVSAEIRTNGRLVFINTEHHLVELGVNYLKPIEILVQSIASAPPQ